MPQPPAGNRRARIELLLALVGYAGILVVLSTALLGWLTGWQHLDQVLTLDTAGYTVLGLGLFLGTILMSCGLHAIIVAVTGTALAVDAALRWLLSGANGPVPLLSLIHISEPTR